MNAVPHVLQSKEDRTRGRICKRAKNKMLANEARNWLRTAFIVNGTGPLFYCPLRMSILISPISPISPIWAVHHIYRELAEAAA
jgi:hypothetical protein